MNSRFRFDRILRLVFAAALAMAAISTGVAAETFVLVPARSLPAEPAKAALADALRLVLEKAEPGARFLVLDPVSRETRASFAVPAGTARLRANAAPVREGLVALRRAFLESPARAPWENGALCLPQTLAHLRAQALAPGGSAIVVFFGDPLHRAPEEAFDWRGGVVPTTGWILGDADSPFAARRLGSLKGLRVHVAAIPAAWGTDDWQRNGTREFLAAMLAEAEGKLVTLADAKLVLTRAADGAAEALPFPAIDRDDHARHYRRKIFVRGQEQEITIKTATDRAVAGGSATEDTNPTVGRTKEEIAPPTLPPDAHASDSATAAPTEEPHPRFTMQPPPPIPLSPRVSPPSMEYAATTPAITKPEAEIQTLVAKANVALPPAVGGIGLVWEVIGDGEATAAAARKADLDLHVGVRGKEGECSWRQMKLPKNNPAMWLHSDVRSARGLGARGNDRQVFEFVEFIGGGREVRLDELTVWVNIYENPDARKIRALMRLQATDGTKFDHVFELPAVRGNHGAGDREKAPQWRSIDLVQVMANSAPESNAATFDTTDLKASAVYK